MAANQIRPISPNDRWIVSDEGNVVGVQTSTSTDKGNSLFADAVPEDGIYSPPPAVGTGPGGAIVLVLGSSIDDGASATNAGSLSYVPRAKALADQLKLSRAIRAGYPGSPPSFISAQLADLLETHKPTHVVLGMGFGTNSANASEYDVYGEFGQYVLACVALCRQANIPIFACTTVPAGISANRLTGATTALGTTSTAIIPARTDDLDDSVAGYYLGAQLDLGDGVIRSVRSWVPGTRTVGFTPVAGAAVASGATVVISGTGVHRGTAAQRAWLATNCPRLGVPLIDMHTQMSDSRGFLRPEYCTEPNPIHPQDVGHNAAGVLFAAALDELLPDVIYPVSGLGGLSYNPWFQGPASGSLPGGFSSVGSPTMGGTRTHTITAGGIGPAPGNTWQCVYDLSGGGSAGVHRYLQQPALPCQPGESYFLVGTMETVGVGAASLVAWNQTTGAAITSFGGLTDTAGPKVFAAEINIPAGCTSWAFGTSVTLAAGQTLAVKVAGLQAESKAAFVTPAA